VKAVAPRNSARRVVTLSGLDGAGKSTQAEWLRAGLEVLGIDAGVEWTRLAQDPVLDAISVPVKRLLGRERRNAHPPERKGSSGGSGRLQRGPLLTYAWTIVVSLANARAHRGEVARQTRRGNVTICDRYVLDSVVHLRRKYGPERGFRLQTAIIRRLSPKPTRSYYLDVPPEIAHARKEDVYELHQLKVHARLYREELPNFPVVAVDGSLPPEDICELILRDAWISLKGSRQGESSDDREPRR
jgi:thymidylate kinase